MDLTEAEKARIKKRLDRYSSKWSKDKLEDTYELINDIRSGKQNRKDWYIPGVVTKEDLIGELLLADFIEQGT